MIVLLGLLVPRLVPRRLVTAARARLDRDAADHGGHERAGQRPADEGDSLAGRLRQRSRWADAAGYTISDLTMLRREIIIGFVVAGFASAAVPAGFWNAVFLHGHGPLTMIENAIVGPFVAIISFVCSVGNVPLAAIAPEHLSWNYTTILNIVFLFVLAAIYWLHRSQERFGGGRDVARDPVCGMQVDKHHPGAVLRPAGRPLTSARSTAGIATPDLTWPALPAKDIRSDHGRRRPRGTSPFVTWARPGRCAIVTRAAEPRSSRPPSQRHAEHTELDPPPYADRAH